MCSEQQPLDITASKSSLRSEKVDRRAIEHTFFGKSIKEALYVM